MYLLHIHAIHDLHLNSTLAPKKEVKKETEKNEQNNDRNCKYDTTPASDKNKILDMNDEIT
jgi:hypothetical protein